MRNKLFVMYLTGILFVIANNAYAGRTWIDILETGINIGYNILQGKNAIDEMANRNRQKKAPERIVYKDRIIYKDNEELSEENLRIKKDLAKTKRYLAWEKAKDGYHKKAIKLYKESLEYDANNWRAWIGYGWSFSELHKYKEAENAFVVAIENGGKDEAWRYLGWNFARQNYQKKAIRCYTESLSLNPSNKKSLYGLKWSQKRLK